MSQTQPLTVLLLASYQKGHEFIDELKRQGCRVLLLTLGAFLSSHDTNFTDPSIARCAVSLLAIAIVSVLALRNIARKWTKQTLSDWATALNRFAIIYEDRLPLTRLGDHS